MLPGGFGLPGVHHALVGGPRFRQRLRPGALLRLMLRNGLLEPSLRSGQLLLELGFPEQLSHARRLGRREPLPLRRRNGVFQVSMPPGRDHGGSLERRQVDVVIDLQGHLQEPGKRLHAQIHALIHRRDVSGAGLLVENRVSGVPRPRSPHIDSRIYGLLLLGSCDLHNRRNRAAIEGGSAVLRLDANALSQVGTSPCSTAIVAFQKVPLSALTLVCAASSIRGRASGGVPSPSSVRPSAWDGGSKHVRHVQ
ncbi:hypothetical protein [Sphaerisporangium rhizosphaerae]|uniref:Uncharacterized protein n=1 Tax=Sphaerisporangium rhizosphaerae TaxID=2269375 RepID=A0ABW2P685_9ACTN